VTKSIDLSVHTDMFIGFYLFSMKVERFSFNVNIPFAEHVAFDDSPEVFLRTVGQFFGVPGHRIKKWLTSVSTRTGFFASGPKPAA
jgi:hypothetical protein